MMANSGTKIGVILKQIAALAPGRSQLSALYLSIDLSVNQPINLSSILSIHWPTVAAVQNATFVYPH